MIKNQIFPLCLLLASIAVTAQNSPLDKVSIRETEVRIIKSSIVDDMDYEIHIALPGGYSESTEDYPVLYYLDAYYWGGIVIETYRLLRAFNEIKPLILVGISYKDATVAEAYRYRCRDLIPSIITEENKSPYSSSIPPASGGSSKFYRFIKEELRPLIKEHYRVDEHDSGILGISAGALFASYVLFHEPKAFNHYILGSPRLDRDHFATLEDEEIYYSKNKSLPVNLFLSVGSEDQENFILSWIKLRDRLRERNYEGLNLTVTAFEGENHTSGIPATISRGIRELYRRD